MKPIVKSKRHLIVASISFIILSLSILFAFQNELRWGGQGYDSALKGNNSSRFAACPHFKDVKLIDILVDSKETVKEVGQINLVSDNGIAVSSNVCWRAMRHVTAPWACSFQKEDLIKLTERGKIEVMDRAGNVIIEDKVDFKALNNFTKELESTEP